MAGTYSVAVADISRFCLAGTYSVAVTDIEECDSGVTFSLVYLIRTLYRGGLHTGATTDDTTLRLVLCKCFRLPSSELIECILFIRPFSFTIDGTGAVTSGMTATDFDGNGVVDTGTAAILRRRICCPPISYAKPARAKR